MRSQSLHARFRTALLVIAALMSTLVAAVVYHVALDHYLVTGEASARAVVAAVQQSLTVGVYARDNILLTELVDGLARHPSVAEVVVLEGAATPMAGSHNPAFASRRDATKPSSTRAASFEALLYSPFDATEPVGKLQVWLDTENLAADARRQAGILVAGLVVTLCAMLVVFNALASRLLSRPMHALADQLVRIKPGEQERLHIERQHLHDEVGVVARAANQLLDLQQQALQRERAMREEIATLEAQYRGIFDSTSAGIFLMTPDGVVTQSNPALSRLIGHVSEGRIVADTCFADPDAWWRLVNASKASGQPEAADLRLMRSDGTHLWVHCMVSYANDGRAHGGGARLEGVLYDITERKRQEAAALHQAEHDALTGLKSRAYIEASLDRRLRDSTDGDGAVTLMFIDLDGFKSVNDRWGHAAGDAVLVEAARRLTKLFQRKSDSVGRLGGDELVVMIEGVEANDVSVSERATALIKSFARAFALPNGEVAKVGASVGVASYPLHATTPETLIHAADAAMYAVKQSGKGGFVIATSSLHDDAARTAGAGHPMPAPLHTVGRDPLTGLYDRWQLTERMAAHCGDGSGLQPFAALICVDLDNFKSVNLAHGLDLGDEVLRETARRLVALVRSGDFVARTGSDEFVVGICLEGDESGVEPSTAQSIAHKLLSALRQPYELACGTVALQASAGIAIAAQNGHSAIMLREAQLALRQAKAGGRGRPVVFEPLMMSGFAAEVSLEEDLRLAIGTQQFFLHVQPQVDQAGVQVGGEVLVRWQHPTKGVIPPDQFIALAESCGAIVELGRWILREGCMLLARLQQLDPRQTLSINISPAQFNHPEFVADVVTALQLAHAPACGLVLEITEGLLITDLVHVTARMRELVDLGVRFSIDDFGTGFSSLAYLRQLPLHEIKVDRSFVNGLPGDVRNAGIVRSILSMGSHLGMRVVAEGVELDEQSKYLIDQGCPAQQGWLHGRPVPVHSFLDNTLYLSRQEQSRSDI